MEKILKQKLTLPNYLSPYAKDILTRLLRKLPSQRLAAGKPDLQDIRTHKFFRTINWAQIATKECPPPIVPQIKHPEDTSCFDESFVSQPLDSPPHSPKGYLGKSLFKGFSYTHPHLLDPQNAP